MSWRDQWVSKSDLYRRATEGGIIFILTVIGIVVIASLFSRSSNAANRIVCASHLRNLSQAVIMYLQDNDGYPLEANWQIPLVDYVDNLNNYTCPSDQGIRPKKNTKDHSISAVSYWYQNPGTGSDESSVYIFGDRIYPNYSGNHDLGGNISFLDGHVKWRTSEQWKEEGLPFESYSGGLIK
ncbi:MAG: hypothetical protein ACYC0V_13455 [Armatimonadota bacterium]